jgi:acetyltransferase-like isoleucine patch superfamily enzyme
MWTNQYVKENFHKRTAEEREAIGAKCLESGKKRDAWQKDFRGNREFLINYTNIKYERASLREKRNKAYTERYHAGKNLFVEYDVNISRQHYLDGKISIGNNVLLGKHVFIDYSGELIIHDNVAIANGVIIETHTHPLEKSRQVPVPSRLEIGEGVKVLSQSYIADTCHSIGRYARIGAGTYVRSNIPPYAIVMGNPAKIIGFLYSPEEMVEFERDKYPESERTSLDQYTQWYEKYFRSRSKEIKSFIKL